MWFLQFLPETNDRESRPHCLLLGGCENRLLMITAYRSSASRILSPNSYCELALSVKKFPDASLVEINDGE
jgi:hypothetical protein